ncbi:MAG: efflux RND transporter permease subunit [Candidatus Peribacteria bacterium]|nr:MAG: efflux RND transporter permease subunit [Candidatus Peribacteria bacterium]
MDDATVVVENMSRHIHLRQKTGKTIKQAILDAIAEVELGVILSTITRLLAFIAMFFVSGMMGDYMSPIPKYAMVTMIVSTTIALSINPFLAYTFEKSKAPHRNIPLLHRLSARYMLLQDTATARRGSFGKSYQHWLKSYVDPTAKLKRTKFKRIFWLVLVVAVVVPISTELFKARMLPKSNQEQIYLRLNASRDSNIAATQELTHDVQDFLNNYSPTATNSTIAQKHRIIENISWWEGMAPMLDFSNLFRGSQSR